MIFTYVHVKTSQNGNNCQNELDLKIFLGLQYAKIRVTPLVLICVLLLEELAGFVSKNTDRSEENKSDTISKVLNEISITGFPGNSYQDLPETGLVSNPLKNTSLQEPGILKSPSLIQYQIYDG